MLVLACTALLVAAGYYVLVPLFKEPKGNLDVELLAETELDRLLNRKAVVYSNLKELEFEYKMGRLADSDYHRLESSYKNEAASILQKLDLLGAEKDIDETIERDIAARKARLASGKSLCPTCGAEIISGKKFCADCGALLTKTDSEQL